MFSFPFLSSSEWSFAFVACLTLSNHRLCELCSAPLNSVLDDCWVCGTEKVHPVCWLLYHMCANLCPSLVLYSWLVCVQPRRASVQNALLHPKSRWYVLRRTTTLQPHPPVLPLYRMQIMLLRCPRVHLLDTFSSKCALSLLATTEASSSTRYDWPSMVDCCFVWLYSLNSEPEQNLCVTSPTRCYCNRKRQR